MELFPVTRYLGTELPSTETVLRNLRDIQNKVRRSQGGAELNRKEQNESHESDIQIDEHQELEVTPKRKKKKELVACSEEDVSEVTVKEEPLTLKEEGEEVLQKVKKLKKKKVAEESQPSVLPTPKRKKHVDDTEVDTSKEINVDKTEFPEQIGKSKKKKRRNEAELSAAAVKSKKETSDNLVECDPVQPLEDESPETGVRLNKKRKRSKSEKTKVAEKDNTKVKRKRYEDTDSEDEGGIEPSQIPVSGTEVSGFTVIGEVDSQKRRKVARELPDWLANPTVVSSDLHSDLKAINDLPQLDPELTKLLGKNGITHFFPVQSAFIAWQLNILQRSTGIHRMTDACVSAPTGSGKTLAYVLPILNFLKGRILRCVKALVILPVRDLAVQVAQVFTTYGKPLGLSVGLLVGQHSIEQEQSQLTWTNYIETVRSNYDIIVATPGRLVDHIRLTPNFSLKDLKFLVIDEADRVMDEIKQDWLSKVEVCIANGDETLLEHVRSDTVSGSMKSSHWPQRLLFSATLSQNPEKLYQMGLFHPTLFTSSEENAIAHASGQFIGKYSAPKELSEAYVISKNELKPLALLALLHRGYRQLLCFTKSVESSHRLCQVLSEFKGYVIHEFSSAQHLRRRGDVIKKFEQGRVDVIVCTDAMARGMDIGNVRYVIQYDVPPTLRMYVHRAGRTARAGHSGTAITLLNPNDAVSFHEKFLAPRNVSAEELKLTEEELSSLESKFQAALEKTRDALVGQKRQARSKWRKKPLPSRKHTVS